MSKLMKAIARALLLVLALTLASSALAAERTATIHNPNPTDRLNLRKSPSAEAISLGKYYSGVVVEQLADAKGGWVKVRVGNLEGYMQTEFLEMGANERPVASAMPAVRIQNDAGYGLNLRERQSATSKSLGLYANGASVRVLGISETWAHVTTADGKTGFMLLDRLSPRLQYQYETGEPADSPDASGAWAGPVGWHAVAEWPVAINDFTAVVNNPNAKDRLHLRTAPAEKAESLGKYYNGVRTVIQGPTDGTWTAVAIGNLQGYMKSQYLAITGESTLPASAMPVLIVSNPSASGYVNLREKQSIDSRSLGLYANGTQVILMGFEAEWAHVIVDGRMGFMLAKYLK